MFNTNLTNLNKTNSGLYYKKKKTNYTTSLYASYKCDIPSLCKSTQEIIEDMIQIKFQKINFLPFYILTASGHYMLSMYGKEQREQALKFILSYSMGKIESYRFEKTSG